MPPIKVRDEEFFDVKCLDEIQAKDCWLSYIPDGGIDICLPRHHGSIILHKGVYKLSAYNTQEELVYVLNQEEHSDIIRKVDEIYTLMLELHSILDKYKKSNWFIRD
jgi:hypothetical protein